MSLYNLLHGHNPFASLLLEMIGQTPESVGRFRDCYLDRKDGKLTIVVYTRNGGGNRECWRETEEKNCNCAGCIITEKLPCDEGYVEDWDDDFDNTYASIRFTIPETFIELCEQIAGSGAEQEDPGKRMVAVIEKLQSGDKDDPTVQRVLKAMEPTMKQIGKALEKGNGPTIIEI